MWAELIGVRIRISISRRESCHAKGLGTKLRRSWNRSDFSGGTKYLKFQKLKPFTVRHGIQDKNYTCKSDKFNRLAALQYVGSLSIGHHSQACETKQTPPLPGGEFLSDAPFFGLSLWTEFKLANCACVSGWSCLMNLDLRSPFLSYLGLGSFVGVSSCWPGSSKKELCTL